MTAEVVADYLQKPLYSIGVGELGTNQTSFEKRLQQILEDSARWQAILLLDEADIFLEERSLRDVKKNAIAGIFLRLLEYYQGILFLTTNRVRSFDSAFHSRISVALRYNDLDEEARYLLWKNLLADAKIDVPSKELSKAGLNGRQIRNSISLAQTLAAYESRAVTYEDLVSGVRQTEEIKNFS